MRRAPTWNMEEEIPFVTADYRFVERMKGVKGIIKLSDID
jgi:hypothetical protein